MVVPPGGEKEKEKRKGKRGGGKEREGRVWVEIRVWAVNELLIDDKESLCVWRDIWGVGFL